MTASLDRLASGLGLELLQSVQRLVHDAVGIALGGGQIEQQRLDIGVDQVRGDLRTHHTRTQHGDFADHEIFTHCFSPETKMGKASCLPLVQTDY